MKRKFNKHNNKYRVAIAICVAGFMALWSACDENKLEPVEKNSPPPGKVSNVSDENRNGKAKISYALPEGDDLQYVRAEYELNSGKTREVKASYYNNSLIVDGFGDTLTHQVKLYTVNRSEVSSDPVEVTVKPKVPPIYLVFNTLEVRETFGGISIRALNEFEEDVAIEVLVQDSLNAEEWVSYDAVYTAAPELDRSLRGMDTASTNFAFYVRDRWLNRSDTLYAKLKPLYETKLDKNLWSEMLLPGDHPMNKWSRALWMLWDEGYSGWGTTACSEDSPQTEPYWFTWDMGNTAKISRFRFWLYQEGQNTECNYYCGWAPIQFEIWGTNDPPQDGNWDGWEKLQDCLVQKPSRLPYGQESSEDREVAAAGIEFEIPIEAPDVRYIRMKIIHNAETYAGLGSNNGIVLTEVSVWGQVE